MDRRCRDQLLRPLLILLDRGIAAPELWLRGVMVDGVEGAIAVPILASLVLVAPQSELLVATVLAALLGALAIAQRMRETSIAALEVEQANARRDSSRTPRTGGRSRRC